MPNLYLVRGLPGSGKTTLAESIADMVFSSDNYFTDSNGDYKFIPSLLPTANSDCKLRAEQAMHNGIENIAVANAFIQDWEFAPYSILAKENGYTVFHLICENRHMGENIHNVPETSIRRMRRRFEIKL